ncbi:hypothetical protein PGB90_000027 [Kerria lacca]
MLRSRIFSKTLKLLDRKPFMTFQRYSSTCKKLLFEEFGDPLKVLKLKEETLPSIKEDEVFVRFLIAPVNPADINLIQGVYPIKSQLPAVGGIEGVGEIIEAGSKVPNLKPGDYVVPDADNFGAWRTCGVFKYNLLYKVPNNVNPIQIGAILSNPSTAYRMLKDFVLLKSGDVVIQNGANSACGQNVIQLCRINNFISINIIRDRPDIEQLKSYLFTLGADYVLTEEELRKTEIFKLKEIPKPKLALNCVGGRNATEISRLLADNGIMVTYGGMSREPVTIPTSAFIFKNISFRGYWMTKWTSNNRQSPERRKMIEELASYMSSGKLKAPEHKLIPLENYSEAIMKTSSVQGYTGYKYLFDLTK